MTEEKKIKIKRGFGNDRNDVTARTWNGKQSQWQQLEVTFCTDEGMSFISIGSQTDFNTDPNKMTTLHFDIDDMPSVISSLIKMTEEAHKLGLNDNIRHQLNELNKGK